MQIDYFSNYLYMWTSVCKGKFITFK
uniref:Uncharacterized protein n=1 Tax=Rhizophora mucronata TaxID=61149 RepID=A0A2P2P2V5_RHIMU